LLKLEGSRLVSRCRGGFEDGFFHLMVAGTRRSLARGYLKTHPKICNSCNHTPKSFESSRVVHWVGAGQLSRRRSGEWCDIAVEMVDNTKCLFFPASDENAFGNGVYTAHRSETDAPDPSVDI
jgi:hypothetical protein